MKLSDIAIEPLKSFANLERYVHFYKYPALADWGEFNPEYGSFCSDKQVELIMLKLRKGVIDVSFTDIQNKDISDIFVKNDFVYFPIHPQILSDQKCEEINNLVKESISMTKLIAQPTASIRTLFIKTGETPYFIKVHFPKRLSSLTREVTVDDVVRGKWITNDLKSASDKHTFPSDVGFFPEITGLLYGKSNKHSAGAIIRDFKTCPSLDESMAIPLASLCSLDFKSKKDPPLMFSLAEARGKKIEDYLLDEIITPHMRQWAWFVFSQGILFNSHGQNVVLQFDKNWKIKRFDYRDFQGRLVIPSVREEHGLPLPDKLLMRENSMDVKTEVSACYDFMIGKRFYGRLMEPLKDIGIDTTKLVNRVKEVFHELIKDEEKYFRKTRTYFKGVVETRHIVDTGRAPKYR